MHLKRRVPRSRSSLWSMLRLPIAWIISLSSIVKQRRPEPERLRTIWQSIRAKGKGWPLLTRASEAAATRRPTPPPVESNETPRLTDLIDHNIETIISLHMHAELKVNYHQRFLERVTAQLGRPRSFYLVLLAVVLWIVINSFAPHLGLPVFDPVPFPWLQGVIGLSALLMTILVLTTQNRQAKLAERRKHLDLQVNLIVEHKVSKLIALVEELRRDTPMVKDRCDQEAEAMSEAVDPQAMFLALDETLEEASREVEQTIVQSEVVMNVETIWHTESHPVKSNESN